MPKMRSPLITAFTIAALAVLFWTGCSRNACGADKSDFLDAYYQLLAEAKAADLPASDPRWADYDEAYRSYVEECYDQHAPTMSRREKRRFWAQSLKYYYQRYGDGLAKEWGRKEKRTFQKIKGEVGQLWEAPEKVLDNTLKGIEKDWKQLKKKWE